MVDEMLHLIFLTRFASGGQHITTSHMRVIVLISKKDFLGAGVLRALCAEAMANMR